MTAPPNQVFGQTVAELLATVSTSEPGDRVTGITFDVRPETTIMTSKDAATSFQTPKGENDKEVSEAFVGALLGQLSERNDRWGALFNYPRTLLVGPKAAFKCNFLSRAAGTGKWDDKAQVTARGNVKRHVRDYDQIVWINHCGDPLVTFLPRWQMPRTIEIGVMRLRQESRAEEQIAYETAWVRVVDTRSTVSTAYPPMDEKKPAEAEVISTLLDLDGGYVLVRQGNTASHELKSSELGTDDSKIGYVSMAAVILERVMRDRTTKLSDLLSTGGVDAGASKMMVQSVLSGQVPYAESDLNPDTRQPAVMPGLATPEKIVKAMMYVTGRYAPKPEGMFAGRSADASVEQRARAENPYARMAAPSDTGDRASNPYARFTDANGGGSVECASATAAEAGYDDDGDDGDADSLWSLSPNSEHASDGEFE